MKHKASILFFTLFFLSHLCFGNTQTSVPKGVDLCREVENLCRSAGISTLQSHLVTSISRSQSEFPFNIEADFPAKTPSDKENQEIFKEKLLLIVSQEDFISKPGLATNLLHILSAENHNYDIKILLSYEENTELTDYQTISGTRDYITKLENIQDYAVLLLSLNGDRTKVVAGSGNLASPAWIARTAYDSINKNKILSSFQSCYISFMYKHELFTDTNLEAYLKAGLPAIRVTFSDSIEEEKIENFVKDFMYFIGENDAFSLDSHSIMVSVFHKSIWINERTITRLIVLMIFLTFLLLVGYGFFNDNFRLQAWRHIKRIWFYPVIIFVISNAIFFSYKGMLFLLSKKGIEIPVYTSICFILPLNMAIISYAFIAALKFTPTFKRRTVDYLTLFCASINLILFPLYDITLFPIFAVEFILAWLATIFTRNIYHILILILFEIPFLPFLLQLFNTCDPVLLISLLEKNNLIAPTLFLLLLPQYLNCFRVFTGLNFYWFAKKSNKMSTDRRNLYVMALFLISFEVILSLIFPSSLKKNPKQKPAVLITESQENFLKADLSSTEVFGDIISTIKINSDKKLSVCDIKVSGKSTNPVLFSDHDLAMEDAKTALFLLPAYPPKDLSFSYGTNTSDSADIIVTGIYEEQGSYFYNKITIHSEAKSEDMN